MSHRGYLPEYLQSCSSGHLAPGQLPSTVVQLLYGYDHDHVTIHIDFYDAHVINLARTQFLEYLSECIFF